MIGKLLTLAAVGLSAAAYLKAKEVMARIDDLEAAFNRLGTDTTKAADTLRAQAAEIKALQDAVAGGEVVPTERFDALTANVNALADSLEAMGTAGPANPVPVPVPAPTT